MADQQQDYYYPSYNPEKKFKNKYLLHAGLFIITFMTTTFAGVEWTKGIRGYLHINELLAGLPYSISIMFIITCHEFGHYFAARTHKVRATLPYYIPFPPIPIFLNFGTMGALIRTKSPIYTKKIMFDIGAAGPIAGFVACLAVLIYGFLNVPGLDYILSIHPNYLDPAYGKQGIGLVFGDTLLFSFLKMLFIQNGQFFPPMSEVYHYPYLCVGWFGLFITSMNMIPVGQLDGGHISYTLFGDKIHTMIASVSFIILFVLGLVGILDWNLALNIGIGWSGWLFWSIILFFFIKIKHPPIADTAELDPKRKFLGYLSFFIFVISFSPTPFELTVGF